MEGREEEGVEGEGRDEDLMGLTVNRSRSLSAGIAGRHCEGALEHEGRLLFPLSALSSMLCDWLQQRTPPGPEPCL